MGIVVSLALLVVVLRRVDLGAALDQAKDADLPLLLTGILGVNLALVPQAVRWRSLSAPIAERLPSSHSFLGAILSAQAVNAVIPARAGDILRIAWLSRAGSAPPSEAAASMLADRMLDVLFLAAILAAGFPIARGEPWATTVGIAAIGACVLLVGMWIACRLYARRRPLDATLQRSRIRGAVVRFAWAITRILTTRRTLLALVATAASWTIWAVGALALARSLDLDLELGQVFFVGAVLNVGLAIPSSPGFVGTYQWLIVEATALFAIGASEAFAFAVILQVSWLVPQALLGFVLLPRLGLSLRTTRRPTPAGAPP